MKKVILLLFLFVFFSCESYYDGDDRTTLPKTDTSIYIRSTKIIFPKGTCALDIYNTLYEVYGEGEHTVTGYYSRSSSSENNGIITTNTLKVDIISFNLFSKLKNISSVFQVNFKTNKNSAIVVDSNLNVVSNSPSIPVLNFSYEWQYSIYNDWNNNSLDGTIEIIL